MSEHNKRYMIMEAVILSIIIIVATFFGFLNRGEIFALIVGAIVFLFIFLGVKIFFIYLISLDNRNIVKNEALIDRITDIMPGGSINFILDDELTITYINKKFLMFTGYSKGEIKEICHNKFLFLIDEGERNKVLDILYNQTVEESKSQLYHRLICKNGERKGIINMFRSFDSKNGKKIAHCLLIDPSALRQVKLEKDIDAERYRIVAEQSESIIFDFNVDDGSIYLNSHFKEKFGYEISKDLIKRVMDDNIIKNEDFEKFVEMSQSNCDYKEIEARIKKLDGTYIWCKLRISTIFDENKKPIRLVGKIIDVDKSRREKLMLIEKTKTDIMSGFYNKIATENIINDEILHHKENTLSALMVIDIDNFKQINDEFGHIQGDSVLSEICNTVKPIFRSSDILGRVGGDEFVVFIKDLHTEEHATKKAKEILQNIEKLYTIENDKFLVSVSIGIAFFDKDGKTYKELFTKADKALYKAKKKGKNTFEIC